MNKNNRLFLTLVLFIAGSCASNASLYSYHPRIGDIRIGNFVWLPISQFFDKYNRYAASKPTLIYDSIHTTLKFINPFHQRFTLVSQYLPIGQDVSIGLKLVCSAVEYYERPDKKHSIVVRIIDGDSQVITKSFSLSDKGTGGCNIMVKKSVNPLKVVLDFDADFKKAFIKEITLDVQSSTMSIESVIPKFCSVTQKPFFTKNEKITFRTFQMKHDHSRDHAGIQIANSKDSVVYSASGYFADTVVTLGTLPIGWYRIKTTSISDKNAALVSVYEFPVMPEPVREVPSELSAFGIHVEMNADGLNKIKYLGAGWVRLHSADILKWKTIEAERGKWNFPDSIIDSFHNSHISILANLGQTPDWASSYLDTTKEFKNNYYFGSAAYLPEHISDWENYVRRVVERYSTKIHYWEIWNEPDIDFLKTRNRTKDEDYATLLKSAYQVIHSNSKKNKIVAPSAAYVITQDPKKEIFGIEGETFKNTRDRNFFKDFSGMDNNKYYDIFSFHHYTQEKGKGSGTELLNNTMLKSLQTIESIKSKHQWVTEYNYLLPYKFYDSDQDDYMANQLCVEHFEMFSKGIDKVFVYNVFNNDAPTGRNRNFFYDKNPRKLFLSYSIMTWKLDGLTFKDESLIDNGRVKEYVFSNSTKKMKIYYAIHDGSEVVFTSGGLSTDCLGNTIKYSKGSQHSIPKGHFIYFEASSNE